jgi:hypothetical protein
MLRAAVADADAPKAFSLLVLRDFFSDALTSSAAFSVSLLELSGGVEGFEDERRRWWLGLKGCCAVLIAARPTELAGTAVIALVERKALPSAGENMASDGGVLAVVLVVGWLAAAQSCCKASRFAAKLRRRVRSRGFHEPGDFGESRPHCTSMQLRQGCTRDTSDPHASASDFPCALTSHPSPHLLSTSHSFTCGYQCLSTTSCGQWLHYAEQLLYIHCMAEKSQKIRPLMPETCNHEVQTTVRQEWRTLP